MVNGSKIYSNVHSALTIYDLLSVIGLIMGFRHLLHCLKHLLTLAGQWCLKASRLIGAFDRTLLNKLRQLGL